MKKFLLDLIGRLSSRKFLVTVGGIGAVTMYPQYADKIVQLISVYVTAEGAGDLVKRYADGKVDAMKVQLAPLASDDFDRDTVVPGNISM